MSIESSPADMAPTAESLLRDLGQGAASGVLEISHPSDELSHVWVRAGRIYAMQVPGYRPALGIRLLSGGLVSPEQLSAAAAEQRDHFPSHLIGQVLVAMGFVSPDVIEAFVRDQVRDQVADLLDLEVVAAQFHAGRHVRQDIIEPTDVETLLAIAQENRDRRADVLARVGGPAVVPVLGPPTTGPTQTPLGPYDWALLCRVDGRRDLTELARVCGFTVVEAAQVVADLVTTGLLALPRPPQPDDAELAPVVSLHPDEEPEDPQWAFDGTAAGEPDPVETAEDPDAHETRSELMAEFGALLRDEPQIQVQAEQEDSELEEPEPENPPLAVVAPTPESSLSLVHAAAQSPLTIVSSADPPELALVGSETEPHVDATGPAQASGDHNPDPPPPTSADAQAQEDQEVPAEGSHDAQSDTTMFMRELSSLSDDPDKAEPVVTRLVVPLTEQRRKRRIWGR